MPKIRKHPEQMLREAKVALDHEILMRRTDLGLRQHDLAESLEITDAAVSITLKDLDRIKVPRLRVLIRVLGIDPITILRWLGYAEREIKSINKEN